MSELTPKHVLVDLFGGADFDHEILDPDQAADLVIDRLRDAGFEIVPADRGSKTGAAAPDETVTEVGIPTTTPPASVNRSAGGPVCAVARTDRYTTARKSGRTGGAP